MSGQGLITMEFIRTTTRVEERVVIDGEFSPMVMNTADRIVNIIWNTKVQEMHEEVADNIHDSFLIYDNLFTHTLSLNQSAPEVQETLDYIKRLSKNVDWEAYSDRALEFLYRGDEVEELISDEAEEEVIAQCAWQLLAESCLFELLSHLQMLAEDDEENAAAYKEKHEEYDSLGDPLFS